MFPKISVVRLGCPITWNVLAHVFISQTPHGVCVFEDLAPDLCAVLVSFLLSGVLKPEFCAQQCVTILG